MRRSRKKTGGSAIRPARSPVLAIRIPAAGMTLSDYAARLLTRGQEAQEGIVEARGLLQRAKTEAKRIVDSSLETALRRQNWRPDGMGKWGPPELHGLPPDGFGPGTAGDDDLFTDWQPDRQRPAGGAPWRCRRW